MCQGNGEAARRKFVRKPGQKPQKQNSQMRGKKRKSYSGDTQDHGDRMERKYVVNTNWKCETEALKQLQKLGFLEEPGECPTCKVGQMLGPFQRHTVKAERNLYFRCSHWECKRWMNCLAFQSWLTSMSRFTYLHPSSLMCIVHAYLANTAPRPTHAFPLVTRAETNLK